ncbi:hypothetical protein QCD70_15510 [Agreia sp. PsM10]|uniref:hypothetical protein n=1 Tax=Agreia sp. PsM10 TaxID=3030533 RepID=UPI00263B290E|nr:hypothetical protein [Agreia sp. PsM10]MDN4641659.1 hypothetical protein [Agreia sp. PsM10]
MHRILDRTAGSRMRAAALLMVTAAVAVGLVGCTPGPLSDDRSTEPTTQNSPPAQAGEAPTVEISFEHEGREVTVTGHPDRPLCQPDGAAQWSTWSAADDSGASIPDRAGDDVFVGAWAVSDFAVLFTGKGAVLNEDDGIMFGTEIPGEVLILERSSTDLRVAELDTDDAVRVDATLTFALECAAD